MTLLPETTHRIDTIVTEAQAAGAIPSLIVGVVRDGRLAHVSTAGSQPAADPDMQYRIGSISKTMTAVLLLSQRDAGRLALDDPLERHLPGTPVGTVTLRQLLGHASGLQREPDGSWWERTEGADLATLVAGLTAGKLTHPPQTVYHYSNLAYGLLGGVLERLTGQPWWELVRTRLLDPLGMARTTYQATEPFARGYVVHPWNGTMREEPRTDTGAMAAAGQLWSTPADLARWAAFLADPDPAVLRPETLAEMCLPVIMSEPDSWGHGHGLGIELTRSGDRVYVGHGGSMPGYLAALGVHRPSRTGLVAFANCYNPRTLHLGANAVELLDLVLDADPPAPAQPWSAAGDPPRDAADLLGRWWWMGKEFTASWDADNDELVFAPQGRLPWRLTRAGTDRWRCHSGMNNGEFLTVRRDPAGRPDTVDIATFVFSRDPDRVG
ncbi:serine hydrolase [Plantactinospora sp. KBS50]|uniref:serine hydrolase domain-containing protein n=1 Tax=Plantactinospora sp. KBS50 TaxID=2024580 RepID=UPI000BAABFF6|nr:serine hydrolase domain-containing protein [Plantactinospora sp. KBS50]ASW55856.1 serine hydrolase [Plantactinospora sp. KBS50]